ncbi:MAG: 5'-3' exonuclease H3TH domain-containing protein [Acidimicrobiia bacterium]
MRLHLLDGTYELFRAYFGFPRRTRADGKEVGAVLGLIETTLRLLREPGVTHVAAATDQVIRSFRNELFPGYKTEEGVDSELLEQFPWAERALESLGVVVWPLREFEADDGMATAAILYADEVEQVVLLTPDKDLTQCVVGRHIVTFDRRKQQMTDEDGVWERFGVAPESIPDYLALVGDSADRIPGIPGWGPKSASTLLAHYGRIDRIPPEPSDWAVQVRGAARLAGNLQENLEEAFLYRRLTTLRRDVPLSETLADLEWQGVNRDAFLELCDEFDFTDVRDRPHRWQQS